MFDIVIYIVAQVRLCVCVCVSAYTILMAILLSLSNGLRVN